MFKRLLPLLGAVILLAGFALGCGGDKDKGINRGKDKPLPAEMERKGNP